MFINLLEIDAAGLIVMDKTTIHQVIGVDETTLIVFVATEHCWQLGLISPSGAVRGERKIYYSAEVALRVD